MARYTQISHLADRHASDDDTLLLLRMWRWALLAPVVQGQKAHAAVLGTVKLPFGPVKQTV